MLHFSKKEAFSMETFSNKPEELYRTLIELSPDGIYIQKAGTIIFANQRLHEMLGYRPGELIGLKHWRIYHPDYQSLTKQRAQARFQGEIGPSIYEVKLQRKDESWLYVELNANIIRIEGQEEIQVWVKDITERKQAEEALGASEEKYRIILGAIKEGYYETDLQGNFTFFNDSLCEIFGYVSDELQGLNYRKVVTKKYARDVFQAFNDIYRTGRPLSLINHEIVKKDGEKKYVELSASLSIGDNGKPIGYYGIIRDITDRKQAEREIEKRQKFLESVLYNAPDAVITLDASHHVTEWNPGAEQIFGYSRNEAIDIDLDDLIAHKDVVNEAKMLTRHILSGNRVTPRELVRYRKDGTEVAVIASGSPIIIDGKLQGLVVVYTDITGLKQAEEEKTRLGLQLQHAQKMEAIGTLSAGIAHNFNNLLMTIQGNTSLILLKTDPSDPNYVRLKNIERAVESGAKLNSQLLGYAREGSYEIKLLDMNQLITETLDTFGVTKREVRVHKQLARDIWMIMGDKGQIEQVLLNLFINAADAMPRGGDLFVKTEKATDQNLIGRPYHVKHGKYVLITLRDTGMGMDEKTMDRIFDPFFTTKGLSGGTGLGLASLYGIIKAHRGYIDVKSKKGQGTTFRIYLPASGKKLKKEHERVSEMVTGNETVLLVDDEEMILDVGLQMLEALGYKVLVARGGKEAVDVYRDNMNDICLVILDMVMPDMAGEETYERLKEINPSVKVLLSSGYSIKGRAHKIMLKGCDGFIQKPFGMKDISQKIRDILNKKNL
jgi:two-component system, cell cycle sensor histidine kinase and response regulator CckA